MNGEVRENPLEFGENHFGEGEEEEGRGDENDGGNKRIKEMQIDRFSELPNSLIIHILSFLNVKEAAITSVLSKRWEFLWAELPNLEFRADMTSGAIEKVRNFVSWVNRTLTVRTGNYLEKFEVSFLYRSVFSSDVDAWVQFATKNKVKKLNLYLHKHGVKDFYTPPQALYSCPSLTTLHVRGCIMKFNRTIEWQSLTTIHLQVVYMGQCLLDEILSNCPVLYTLILEQCCGFNRLEVKSRILHSLSIVDCQNKNEPSLKISAPYIHKLYIFLSGTGRMLQVGNISSLVEAEIDYQEFPLESSSLEVMSGARELLESLQNVEELSLGPQFLKVVSLMVVDGWQLPQSRRKILKVDSSSEYHELNVSGIFGFLESSPNLETLVIMGYATDVEDFILVGIMDDDLAGDLLHLKNIIVRNFANSKGEPMLSLARILLKRATVLEAMMMTTDVEDLSDYAEMVQAMLTYPRSSTKALVHLLNDNIVLMQNAGHLLP